MQKTHCNSSAILCLLLCVSLVTPVLGEHAQKTKVKIIDRRSGETFYSYQVPAHSTSTTNSNVNCAVYPNDVSCTGSSTTNGYSTGPRNIAYSVTGATLALLLPDGRTAVVNCVSKYKLKMDYVNRRSCRAPLVDDVEAEFSGKSVKLFWPVSIDGKKFDSETYKILGIMDKQ
jgi:hypothetical protein